VIAEYLLDRDAASAAFLDTASIERLVKRQREGITSLRDAHALLAILMLEVWLSSFLPRATRPVNPVAPAPTAGATLK